MFPDWLGTVHHDGSSRYVSQLYPRMGDTVRVRLRAGAGAPIKRVFLRICPDGEQALTPMTAGPARPPAKWFEADLAIREPTTHYRFLIEADDGIWWYTAAGPVMFDPLDATDFRVVAGLTPPDWVRSSVFYQIFPDRFANGDPALDPRSGEYEYKGHKPRTFPWESAPPEDHPFPIVFYGGDLPGITQRLGYLADLGVNALYLTPIFTSPSNHRYDVADYEHVDRHLGGDEALVRLRQALTERKMRYLMDIVPNHIGYWHGWFQKARADATAAEARFFSFSRHPDEYYTWLGVWSLPKLNYRSEELRRRMLTADDSILRRWLRPPYAADGWRVDVANMLGRQGDIQMNAELSRILRRVVKDARPDAYLLGENFFDATAQLQGDQYDGIMNYASFAFPLWHWLRGYRQTIVHGEKEAIVGPRWSTAALEAAWRNRRAAVPWGISLQQYNQLDSHDTPRIRSIVGGNDALHRLAAAVQLTFPGIPGLYYGDEIGMEDVPQLAQRGCMIWDEKRWNTSLRDYYRDLIALRRSSAVLQEGGFQMLAAEPDTFAFQREATGGRVLVVAHRGAQPRPAGPLPVAHGGVPDGTSFTERFSGATAVVRGGSLPLPAQPQGAAIWISNDPV
jgi:alpha-glucosidase